MIGVLPRRPARLRIGAFPVPAEATGTPAEVVLAIKEAYRMLERRLSIFVTPAALARSTEPKQPANCSVVAIPGPRARAARAQRILCRADLTNALAKVGGLDRPVSQFSRQSAGETRS